MKLLIVRHAIAMDREDFKSASKRQSDDMRPLTDEGVRKMRKNAKGLARIAHKPDLVISSPLVRAIQTSEILQIEWSSSTAKCDALKPDAAPIELARWLAGYKTAIQTNHTVAIVGHEPHLSRLIAWCLESSHTEAFELKKGGACLIEFE
ncbi:MAG TPA: histidine phosphatase family protein, partial [Bdellovibrionales bacterium]|nr:histidine phosphatase family protein [Bdellovibrionales bacterium]